MKERKKISLIIEVVILSAVCVLMTGFFTDIFLYLRTRHRVAASTEYFTGQIAEEVKKSVEEYPANEWLLKYWYDHSKELDIEYDVPFERGTRTEEKCRLLISHVPDLQIRYADTDKILSMSAEDQKLYAEIAYSWLITRIDQIKQSYHVDFLFCVVSDETCKTQFFLFSAADKDSVRGTNYEEVYTLGVTVDTSESQQEAMRGAKQHEAHLADAGDYVDYYAYLSSMDEKDLFLGLTYDLSALNKSVYAQTWEGAVFASSFQILLSVFFLLLIFYVVINPLKKVQTSIRLYKETKDSAAVIRDLGGVKLRNEIGQLSDDVKDLTQEIDDYIDRIGKITAEKERIGTELETARRIQSNMMPHTFPPFPDKPEFDIYADMDPAKEVGGDFYDYFLIDEDHLGIVIADVSGKGVPAALLMMATKIIVQNCAMLGKNAAQILSTTNEAVCANNQNGMFVTVWVGILEISTGKLTAANAGHEYPVLKNPGNAFEVVKDKHGLVIGGYEDSRYLEYEICLKPGSKLFVYTDGVPEATDSGEKMFGMERMLEALNEEPDASVRKILENVRKSIDRFVKDAEQFDDLTMLCLEYKGKK